jgi:hypothetical protein
MENQIKVQKPFYKKTWVIVIAVIMFILIIANLGNNESSTSATNIDSLTNSTLTKEENIIEEQHWQYTDNEDQMTNQKRYFASCISSNEIDFDFPYDGGSKFTLTLRNMGKGNEIVLQVSKGQFMPGIMSSEYCRVKFDNGETVNYTYNSAADGSADIIFLDNATTFYKKLKTAKNLMIEAPFFEAGRQIINFNVEGLKWDK